MSGFENIFTRGIRLKQEDRRAAIDIDRFGAETARQKAIDDANIGYGHVGAQQTAADAAMLNAQSGNKPYGLPSTYLAAPSTASFSSPSTTTIQRSGNTYSNLSGYAGGGAVAAPGMDMTHPMYTKYLAAMHRAGMMDRVQPPEMVIPKMAQYDAQNRMALAQQTVNGGTQGFAQGGMVDTGGKQVLGPGTGKSDSIPAMIDGKHPAALSNGEFHFPKQAVDFYGTKVLDAMVAKARQALKLKG